ncbi:MAG: FKBP-type peptidyl-prolyl cis-trans isomerase [Planctomycetes bacterium]|nr:FKBP-type peptidyl-prolyl cis-trans isomerase [Planctomycetota bacterium]
MHRSVPAPLLAALTLLPLAPAVAQDPWPTSIPADADPLTTASGLRYSVLRAGSGDRRPVLGDRVEVRYSGWLEDGTLFDSSELRGAGSTSKFVLGRVIEGWNEGVQLMSPGARFRLTIPAALGYGDQGSPPKIPGGATLVFVVELVDFQSTPRFVPVEKDGAETLECGAFYNVVRAGEGESPSGVQMFRMRYAVWDRDGKLLDSTFQHGGTIEGALEHMRLPFLKELPTKMKPGEICRIQVSREQGFPDGLPPQFGAIPDGVTVWELELVKVLTPMPVPEFRMPKEDELQRSASGLGIVVLQEGQGEPPHDGAMVQCHYAGWLSDGTLFDASYSRGEPLEVEVGGPVIDGWNEALRGMKPGAKWLLVIPPALAYGEAGRPPVIPPSSTLVFVVELLDVAK